jgi:hypothetical protein
MLLFVKPENNRKCASAQMRVLGEMFWRRVEFNGFFVGEENAAQKGDLSMETLKSH